MASSPILLLLLVLLISCFALSSHSQLDRGAGLLTNDVSLEYWPTAMPSLYDGGSELDEEEDDIMGDRRSLYWRRRHYYISYGALSANRIPCPPRSGRSYYTPNCYAARGPVHPYTRGCSAIAYCRG